jgi:peptide-N4-(N-acetyl-beta-glucosaminyl)asparagine amidase
MEADEALARALQAEEEAAARAAPPAAPAPAVADFAARLQSGLATAARYESRQLQAQARAVMPLLQVRTRRLHAQTHTRRRDPFHVVASRSSHARPLAAQLRARAGAAALCSAPDSGLTLHDAFLDALLRWFKHDFFSWVNAPPCSRCGGATRGVGMAAPLAEELAVGAGRVEAYACESAACGAATRFPRINDPGALLTTRRGRCGEYANAFTLCCRAAGLTARYVLDWTDHVWTEVWSPSARRWVHADSCEAARDQPRLYDAGWGKKLSYVIAFSADGAADVTRRYVVCWREAAARRTAVEERWLAGALAQLTAAARARRPTHAAAAAVRDAADAAELTALHAAEAAAAGAGAASDAALPGRESGALEWRAARGELGAGGAAAAGASPQLTPQEVRRNALATALAAALASAMPPPSSTRPDAP